MWPDTYIVDGLKEAVFCGASGVFSCRAGNIPFGVLYLGTNAATTLYSKDVGIRHHFVRDRVELGELRLWFFACCRVSGVQNAGFNAKPFLVFYEQTCKEPCRFRRIEVFYVFLSLLRYFLLFSVCKYCTINYLGGSRM